MLTDLIILAQNKTAPEGGGGLGFVGMLPLFIGMFVIMYLVVWRPEKKRQKKMQQMRDNLSKKDKVVTAGGIRGTVKNVNEQAGTVTVIVDPKTNTALTFSRSAILRVLTEDDQEDGDDT